MSGNNDHTVASPCISICELNEDDVCLGCGRTLNDIAEWSGANNERRRVIVAAARHRLHPIKVATSGIQERD